MTAGGPNETHITKMNGDNPVLMSYARDLDNCSEFTLLGNLFISAGQRGKVLKEFGLVYIIFCEMLNK